MSDIKTRNNISGIPELVENGVSGFLTPPGDVNALSKCIGDLIEDGSLRKKMGAAARQVILRDFNLESNARHLIHMFQNASLCAPKCIDSALDQ